MEDTPAPSPTPEAEASMREMGEYEGITFVVSGGSEATFTVEEQLARLPLPNDAVMRTTTLSGEVHLDGRESVIQIDLHSMSSDQEFRDRYVRTRMFGDHQFAHLHCTRRRPAARRPGLRRDEHYPDQRLPGHSAALLCRWSSR